jgi:hypothetical protein
MRNRVLNITNGDYFNEYFLSKFGGIALPFRENMTDGETVAQIDSEAFVALRAKTLGVSVAAYKAKGQVCDELKKSDYTELSLWFGKDTFCQANLLTLLAYLEQISYQGKVVLNYIDDENFEVIESNIGVELGIYNELYEEILIRKRMPKKFGVLQKRAFELYFDYLDENGALARLVRENTDKDKTALTCLLLENSKAYGLSVEQAERIVGASLAPMK